MEVFTLGERLMIYRKRAKLTKKEVARRIGATVPCITRYENDEAYPDEETMMNLACVLGVSINKMSFGFNDPAKDRKMEVLIKE
ncbi:MAG: helix-turn-helix domain-containing protein [Firmicutes bacterium]|nr:helix-turn-helix domain-containing protein [Bacillota bacterium]